MVAKFGDVNLGDNGCAVYEVTPKSGNKDFHWSHLDGAEVVIPADSQFVVVRNCSATGGFHETHAKSRKRANQALDLCYADTGTSMVVAHKESPYLVGWCTTNGLVLRLIGTLIMTSGVSAEGPKVVDAEGNRVERPVPKPPTPIWHECLRYYRVAEASTDLYDSFRNLYLAIESLLSRQVPPGDGGGETKWLMKALREVGLTCDLGPYAPSTPEPKAPHKAIHAELYGELRTAIFHAKDGRVQWTPQHWGSRPKIAEARLRYSRMFRALASCYLNVAYRTGGGFTETEWRDIYTQQREDYEVFVSGDSTKVEDESTWEVRLAPSGGDHHVMQIALTEDLSSNQLQSIAGVESASTVNESLKGIRGFGVSHGGRLATAVRLQASLDTDGASELQVEFRLEGRGSSQPRQDFES